MVNAIIVNKPLKVLTFLKQKILCTQKTFIVKEKLYARVMSK